MTEDDVYIVVSGNSLSNVQTIEDLYTNKKAARSHKRALEYKGYHTGNDYVSILTRTPKSETDETADFTYRVVWEDLMNTTSVQHVTDLFGTYNKAYDVFKEIQNGKQAVRGKIHRKNKYDTIEETGRNIPDNENDAHWREL